VSIVREVTVVWGRVCKTVVWDVPFKCRMESTGWEEQFVVCFSTFNLYRNPYWI